MTYHSMDLRGLDQTAAILAAKGFSATVVSCIERSWECHLTTNASPREYLLAKREAREADAAERAERYGYARRAA